MIKAQPVKVTSGGGFTFEDNVGASLAAAILSQRSIIDEPLGPPVRIEFQVGAKGWRFDDILIFFATSEGPVRCAMSIKSFPYFHSTAPSDLVARAWEEVTGVSGSGFSPSVDLLGVVTAPLEGEVAGNIDELIRLATHQNAQDLAQSMMTPGFVSRARVKLWNSFADPSIIESTQPVLPAMQGLVLSRFRLLQMDFGRVGSASEREALESCVRALVDTEKAADLWNMLVALVSKTRISGGYLDEDKILAHLDGRFTLRAPTQTRAGKLRGLLRRSNARLVERWMAAGTNEEVAQDLMADPRIGALQVPLPATGLVALIGDFGSGKSVAGERQHQADVIAFGGQPGSALPMQINARDLQSDLETAVEGKASGLGTIDRDGIHLFLDGLDEVGFATGSRLLQQARTLVRALPKSRIVIAARPGFNIRDEELQTVGPMTESELLDLSEKFTGNRFALTTLPPPVRDAVTRPLFAIIALTRILRSSGIPTSRALFIEAMVQDALADELQDVLLQTTLLARAASVSISGSGRFMPSDVGGPGAAAQLLGTRLIVKRESSFAFALPVIEQYFGAHALLHGAAQAHEIMTNLATFERWRYAFVVAIGIGSWDQVAALLSSVGNAQPGAASWIVNEAVSRHGLPDSLVSLPGSLVCAERLAKSLGAWLSWMPGVAKLTKLTRCDDRQLPVGARSESGYVVAALLRPESTSADAEVIGPEVHLMPNRPHPRMLHVRYGAVPGDEQAWPWRWGMDWVDRSLQNAIKTRRLISGPGTKLASEREWSLVRALTGSRSILHPPVDQDLVAMRCEELLQLAIESPSKEFAFPSQSILYLGEEIRALASVATSRTLPFERPWPVPDRLNDGSGSIGGLYSDAVQLTILQQIYSAALSGYVHLVRTYFAGWESTLGWGAALPIGLEITLIPARGPNLIDRSAISVDEYAMGSQDELTVKVHRASATSGPFAYDEDERRERQERLEREHPETAAWARLYTTHLADLPIYGDTPATDLAYEWLWRDLHQIGLISKAPPAASFR